MPAHAPVRYDLFNEPAPADTHVVDLHVPGSWLGPANPQAAVVAASVRRWLEEVGVIRDPFDRERLRRLELAGSGSLPFALARPEALDVCAALRALFLLCDDEIAGLGAGGEELLLGALRGQGPESANESPCLRGMRVLGRRLAANLAAAWLDRHAADVARWLHAQRQEAMLLLRFRAGRVIPVEELMAVRRFSGGLVPLIDRIELDLGAELPPRLREHPALSILVEAACRAVTTAADLHGCTSARAARLPNLVLCAQREDGTGLHDAVRRIAALHDQAVGELAIAGAGLLHDPSLAADRGLVRAFVVRLRRLVGGFALWHARAPGHGSVHVDARDGSRVLLRLAGAP